MGRPSPKLYALAGEPISGSPSPAMHNAAFAALGLEARYELRPTGPAGVPELVAALDSGALAGANITTPLKVLMAARVRLDACAQRAGAVNTVWRESGVLVGALTDVDGVRVPLEALGVHNARALVLGAGGAARAAAVALDLLGCTVCVAARRVEQAEQLVASCGLERSAAARAVPLGDPSAVREALRDAEVVVQATPAGRAGESHSLPWEALSPAAVAFEMLYRPRKTPFLVAAQAHGARLVHGEDMLVEQGARSFELWTGRSAPRELMRTTVAALR